MPSWIGRNDAGEIVDFETTGDNSDPVSVGSGAGAGLIVNDGDTEETVVKLIAPGADLSTPGEADLSTAEGLQRIRLLGPFPVDFDDAAAVATHGVALVELEAETVVLVAWPIIRIDFDGASGVTGQMRIGTGASSFPIVADYDLYDQSAAPRGDRARAPGHTAGSGFAANAHHPTFAGAGDSLRFQLTVDGTATAGQVDCYALVAEAAP
jgi:hypothetical protein